VLSFHHVGFVVASIDKAVEPLRLTLQASWNGEIIHDPKQDVRVAFLEGDSPGDPLFELVEPASEGSPVRTFLADGGGLHHVCYETDELEGELARLRGLGALIVQKPTPAVAFGMRRIAWVYTRQKLLIELLERNPVH
jgi:methylmalonyl-CoA/ethylmalonyl-CoA epimerase